MADININNKKDHFYLVDPGIGEKSDICPYSGFEDGRDVKAYIIPPDGYELSGFKFEPYDSPDHFYEGKVVAQFVKEKSFMEIARPHLWKYITALVAVIGIIVGLILFFGNRKNHEVVYVEAESASTEVPATVDNSIKAIPTETVNTENVTEEAEAQEAVAEQEAVAQQEVVKEEPVKEEVIKEENVQTDEQQFSQEEQEELNAQFKEEFWALIHNQEKNMALYGRLFRAYKDKVECAEFKYMVNFILRNTSDFRAWNENLLSIPSDEIKNVTTIDQLTTLMEEYE